MWKSEKVNDAVRDKAKEKTILDYSTDGRMNGWSEGWMVEMT